MLVIGIIAGIVALGLVALLLFLGAAANRNLPDILAELDKRPSNVSGLVKRTGKNRRVVISSLLTMQDKGYVPTGTKGGMKKLSAIGDHTTFYITPEGREHIRA